MPEWISPRQFHDAQGVEDWRVLSIGVSAHFRTGSFATGVELVDAISAAARSLGAPADPTAVQDVQVTIDALVAPEVRAFWRAVLGYTEKGDADLLDPHSHGPSFWFQRMKEPRPQRNRIHVDVVVPHDQAEARVAAAIAAGGLLVTDQHAPAWWVLADPEGNEACVASWMGRD